MNAIVIHDINYQIDFKKIKSKIWFFDDCLYSQYIFIIQNIVLLQKYKITCILSLSTALIRPENNIPIKNAICSECHEKFHNGNNFIKNAYMSLTEITELLKFKNILLAAHGNNHIQFEKLNISNYEKYNIFYNDIYEMQNELNKLKLKTNIFVFPYAYDNIFLAYNILKKFGYKYFFAGKNTKRTPIETIFSNLNTLE